MALSEDGKARAGMGVDSGDFDNSGRPGLAITNFEGEMIGLYRGQDQGVYRDVTVAAGLGSASRTRLGFGCLFADLDLDGSLDLIVANGHIDDTVRNIRGNVGYAQAPHLFLNRGAGTFRDVASEVGQRIRTAAGRPRARVRRFRSRRRRRRADHDQQRSAGAVPERPGRRATAACDSGSPA